MKELEIKLAEGQKELIVREGSALPLKEPVKVAIDGTIEAPAEYYAKRKSLVEANKAYVLFSYVGMYIKLFVDEKDHYRTEIGGSLSMNPDLKKFGINEGKIWTKNELKQFLKMNRAFFGDVDSNMKIVTNLEKFSMSVQAQIDDHSDNRGNAKNSSEIKVDTNLEMNFVLNLPIFTGQPKAKFMVEICFDVRDKGINLWLESAELQEFIISQRETIINKNIEPFKSDFVVIEK